jgi:soluble lytic murein transglycosylase
MWRLSLRMEKIVQMSKARSLVDCTVVLHWAWRRGLAAATLALLVNCAIAGSARAEAETTSDGSAEISDAAIEAVRLAVDAKYDRARERAQGTDDPALITLIDWYEARDSNLPAGFEGIAAFITQHPHWPLMDTIRTRAGAALYRERLDAARVIGHFTAFPPQNGLGKLALARAHFSEGNDEQAAELVRDAWRNHEFGQSLENSIRSEFGDHLTDADHRARLVRQIYARERAAASRTAQLISSAHVKMARAASSLFRRRSNALNHYRAVPDHLRGQLVMQYALAYYYRRKDRFQQARDIALQVPSGEGELSYPEAWWTERLILARNALRRSTPELWESAYELTSAHGFSSGTKFVQGEFMSGWIALQFLQDPERAIPHLKLILERDEKILNLSQAHYWLGRAYQALGDAVTADQHLTAAAALPTTFYGQLARDVLGWGTVPIVLAEVTDIPDEVVASVGRHDQVRAIHLLHAAGQTTRMRNFFTTVVYRLETAVERAALVHLAMEFGATHVALRVAKLSARDRVDLGPLAYPSDVLPDYQGPDREVELALIHGLIRQESEFNAAAISHAGARGLMQLMPGTAKIIARQHGIAYRRADLTQRPEYNLALGTRHIADLLDDLGGSYIMTIAAYNAGAGRIPQWTRAYGDPRLGEVEPVDWIESIPFNETRNYVKRVIENVQIYRSLFGTTPLVALGTDLTRGGNEPIDTAGNPDCDPEAQSTIEELIACN